MPARIYHPVTGETYQIADVARFRQSERARQGFLLVGEHPPVPEPVTTTVQLALAPVVVHPPENRGPVTIDDTDGDAFLNG